MSNFAVYPVVKVTTPVEKVCPKDAAKANKVKSKKVVFLMIILFLKFVLIGRHQQVWHNLSPNSLYYLWFHNLLLP